ncbi:adenosylmethionine--8-amino-7-oxononanoate transaminase [Flavobacterium sp.]|uniref:adenosylmethionine--8-amino-7-oxononanoate transaminase n=1 Tax=Flavobacterium sp. TaxID=239 RepID=UPI002603FF38|nr:adenosylmethionine--8-amino-7-oxononanoate transaminase [Flavobacterium sp.]MDD3004692.1 adenosylmethionine--8-amino-7-oxononanoate transaminase [Flavobacterium sp.]
MLWFPYTQMSKIKEVPVLKGAKGVEMYLANGTTLVDGIASWWSAVHGYNNEAINEAIKGQLEHFSHFMLGGIAHQPALQLAQELVRVTPQGLNHVFFSDSGSVGVEIALKIALQYFKNKNIPHKTRIAYLRDGYHGDTFKAMEVSSDSDFNTAFAEVLTPQFELHIPSGGFHATPRQVALAVQEMEDLFKKHHHEIACLILEPIVQCAGGFNIYAPEYLAAARALTTQYNILLIADEVATGFGRTGKMFACEHASITPDIMVLGKALTAGYVGHAATLATTEVYNAFLGDSYESALMHGPTFMGNALACTIALKGIALLEQENYLEKINQIHGFITAELQNINSQHITAVRQIGALVALEFSSAKNLQGFAPFAQQNGAWLRPIGNVLYLMPAYIISQAQIAQLFKVITLWINQLDAQVK